jgi:hypothetical protein
MPFKVLKLNMDHKSEFMIGHEGVPVSPAMAEVAYERGWCRRCGLRLSYIGKCPNCDAWWRSPYLAIGLPLLLVNLGVIGLVAARYGHKPSPTAVERISNSDSLTAQPFFSAAHSGSTGANTHYAPSFQPSYSSSASSIGNRGGVQAPPLMSDPWEIRLQELQNLRSMVWQAEAQYKQEQDAPMQSPTQRPLQFSTTSEKTGTTTMNTPT